MWPHHPWGTFDSSPVSSTAHAADITQKTCAVILVRVEKNKYSFMSEFPMKRPKVKKDKRE